MAGEHIGRQAGAVTDPIDQAEPAGRSRLGRHPGPPVDDEADATWPAWTGTIPLTLVRGAPVAAD